MTRGSAPLVVRPRWFTRDRELWTLWVLFLGVHWFHAWVATWHESVPFYDVTGVYRYWVESSVSSGQFYGVHEPFVYPVGALIPMLLTQLLGPGESYLLGWMVIVTVLNSVAFWWLTLRNRDAAGAALYRAAAWWWVAFLALLGPISLGRIDAITVPIVMIALIEIRSRVVTGGFWLTVGAWIKVWPAAAFAAALTTVRRRWPLIKGALIACAVVLLLPLVFNGTEGLRNAFSFVTGQTGRGLQLESTAASVFLMLGVLGGGDYHSEFSTEILTQQLTGPGVDFVAALLTPLMFLVVLALLAYAVYSQRRGAGFARLFPALLLALVTTFIIFNKVGSPQFICWLAPVIVLGLIWDGRRFAPVAFIGIIAAWLTQYLYPWYYWTIVDGTFFGALVLLIRNLLLVVLLGFAVRYMRPLPQRSKNSRTA